MGRSEVSASIVKWMSFIIRRCTEHTKFYCFFLYSFGSILYHCIYGCMFVRFYLILYIMYSYCYVCAVLCILFHCAVLCIVCVWMCTVLLPPGVNPIAVNKYITSHHIISYTILYYIISIPFVLRTRNMSPDMHASTVPLCYWQSSEQIPLLFFTTIS